MSGEWGKTLFECPICKQAKSYRKFSRDSKNGYAPTICTDCARQLIASSGMQKCKACGESKPVSDFHKDSRRSTGLNDICKDCNRVRMRDTFMRRQYGISQEQYDAMYAAQNGLCLICSLPSLQDSIRSRQDRKRAPRVMVATLYVDHDHTTGEVRGLLCPNCNRLIGLVYDNTDFLQSAIDYLLYYRHRKQQSA